MAVQSPQVSLRCQQKRVYTFEVTIATFVRLKKTVLGIIFNLIHYIHSYWVAIT